MNESCHERDATASSPDAAPVALLTSIDEPTPVSSEVDAVRAANLSAALTATDAHQEVDIWWGSDAGWTMLPSLILCVLITAVIAWAAFTLSRPTAQFIVLGVGGPIWLLQCERWAERVFGSSYRLTTRRLFLDQGFIWMDRFQVDLGRIRYMHVEQTAWERFFGVGRICLQLQDAGRDKVTLHGVRDPYTVTKLIEEKKNLVSPALPQPQQTT